MVIQPVAIDSRFPFYWRTKDAANTHKSIETKMLDFELTYDPDFGFWKHVCGTR